MTSTIAPPAPRTRVRAEVHARLEPKTLVGEFGEPLARGVYDVELAGADLFVGINGAGDIIASIRIPTKWANSEDVDRQSMYTQEWTRALARVWIEVERLDPTAAAGAAFPDCRSIRRPAPHADVQLA